MNRFLNEVGQFSISVVSFIHSGGCLMRAEYTKFLFDVIRFRLLLYQTVFHLFTWGLFVGKFSCFLLRSLWQFG
jgi:hypothetical protein